MKLAEFYGIQFYEVSAIHDYNVTETIQALATQMISAYESQSNEIRSPRLEIDDRRKSISVVEGSFSLTCCGPRKESSGRCC